jgi:hypothetical protein
MNFFSAAAGAASDKLQQAQARPLRGLASPPERLAHCVGSLAPFGGQAPKGDFRGRGPMPQKLDSIV